ncbi:MAG: cysteine--tRNA ligase [Clostridia bacterium]|nr:cysteine--tRNA ligase [Clostridia bacterium]
MLKLYNTLTKQKEEFKPIDTKSNEVRIYTCGPTVYSYPHIGNMRAYIFMDNLRKVLKHNGYKLKHVMNITDVGHLTSDADEGEDKMLKSAREKNMSVYDIANMYTEAFLNDISSLNVELPEYITKATDHIKEMEEYVGEIVDNDYGYVTSKGVYFDTKKLTTYGELSKANLSEQKAGARVDVDPEKKNYLDFALWIKAPKEHIMKWDSRWGVCYPGWHIECSAMSRKYLGEEFDIHTGGVDHIPIHHENEIAQSRGATGKNPAHFWMHCEFLLIDSGKMSKSLGNVYTLKNLEEKGIEPLAYRYFTYTSHYRNKLNFTWESVFAAQTSLNRLREAYFQHENSQVVNNISAQRLNELRTKFYDALSDDINVPMALAIAWEVAKEQEKSVDYAKLLLEFDEIFSLKLNRKVRPSSVLDEVTDIPNEVRDIIERRKLARQNKEFALSDELRDKLMELGYKVIDSKDGQKIEVI